MEGYDTLGIQEPEWDCFGSAGMTSPRNTALECDKRICAEAALGDGRGLAGGASWNFKMLDFDDSFADFHRSATSPEPNYLFGRRTPCATITAPGHPLAAGARPLIAATRPLVAATRPLVAATRPLVAATRPLVAATRPLVAATRPLVAATRPLDATTRPLVAATRPLVAATCPLVAETCPLVAATRPLAAATYPQAAATHPVAEATHLLAAATHTPAAALPPLRTTARSQASTTLFSAPTARPRASTTRPEAAAAGSEPPSVGERARAAAAGSKPPSVGERARAAWTAIANRHRGLEPSDWLDGDNWSYRDFPAKTAQQMMWELLQDPTFDGTYLLQLLLEKVRSKFGPPTPEAGDQPICKFCRNNNEEEIYHQFKDASGLVLCPVLSKHVCELCGVSGPFAHTRKYCRNNPLTLGCPEEGGFPPGELPKDVFEITQVMLQMINSKEESL